MFQDDHIERVKGYEGPLSNEFEAKALYNSLPNEPDCGFIRATLSEISLISSQIHSAFSLYYFYNALSNKYAHLESLELQSYLIRTFNALYEYVVDIIIWNLESEESLTLLKKTISLIELSPKLRNDLFYKSFDLRRKEQLSIFLFHIASDEKEFNQASLLYLDYIKNQFKSTSISYTAFDEQTQNKIFFGTLKQSFTKKPVYLLEKNPIFNYSELGII